nr:hypothetical protein [Burkholderia territorii]
MPSSLPASERIDVAIFGASVRKNVTVPRNGSSHASGASFATVPAVLLTTFLPSALVPSYANWIPSPTRLGLYHGRLSAIFFASCSWRFKFALVSKSCPCNALSMPVASASMSSSDLDAQPSSSSTRPAFSLLRKSSISVAQVALMCVTSTEMIAAPRLLRVASNSWRTSASSGRADIRNGASVGGSGMMPSRLIARLM